MFECREKLKKKNRNIRDELLASSNVKVNSDEQHAIFARQFQVH